VLRVVPGQYLGWIGIMAVAVAGALGAGLLPESVLPYLGLSPLALGLRAAWRPWRERYDQDHDAMTEPAGTKDEVCEAILDAAYDRRMTWYGEIAEKVSVIDLDPHSALMSALLGAVFEDEHAEGRPALTSIVTPKYGDKEPGKGFYDKARGLGYRFKEPYIFWAQQVQAVFKTHGKPDRHK
jgi:hypothetical protein